jgi:hypothetical protein
VTGEFRIVRSGSSRAALLAAVVALAGIELSPWVVRASPAPPARQNRRVLLLMDSPGDPLMGRIKAEIASLNLEVVARSPQGPIEASARAENAVAAIRVLPSRRGVEVWMADETSGRSLLRQAIVDETEGGPSHSLIALQTAELLRTSLFPRPRSAPAVPAPSPPLPAPVIVQVAAPPSTNESSLAGGVGLLYAAGGVGPAWQASLSFQHMWGRRFGLALHGSGPLRRGTISGREGSAEIGVLIAAAELLTRFDSEPAPFSVTTGLGAGLTYLLAQGRPLEEAGAQLVSASAGAATALVYGRVSVGWKLPGLLGVGVSGLAGTTVAPVRVRFAANDAGAWGVPLFGVNLFGQVGWR